MIGITAKAAALAAAWVVPHAQAQDGSGGAPEAIEEALGLGQDERAAVQAGLRDSGFDPGPVDGVFGPRTREAIRSWQESRGLPASGWLDAAAAAELREAADRIAAKNPPCSISSRTILGASVVTWSGDCVDGKATGVGRAVWQDSSGAQHMYEGEWRDGKQNGNGTFTWADGNRYEGAWKDNHMHGQGTWTAAGGDRYEGAWRDGKVHGHGTLAWADGNRYEGAWRDGKQNGHGTFTFANGDRYVGGYRNGRATGPATVIEDGKSYEAIASDGCVRYGDGRRMTLGKSWADCGFE